MATIIVGLCAFFKSVTTKYIYAYVKKRSGLYFLGQKLVTMEHYWRTLLWVSNVTIGLFAGLEVRATNLLQYLFPILITITSRQFISHS